MDPGQPQNLGKYKLVQHIATGGMAEVFKAVYEVADGIEKTCVVKRLLPSLARDPAFLEMFRDEARLSLLLSHATFVEVFDFGVDGDPYLAMEYVRGQNFSTILHRTSHAGRRLPRDIAFFICSEVARGLHYAHTKTDDAGQPLNIVHRDVAPDNILVSYEGDVKIADFGIAKAATTTSKTQAGFFKGKASYLAPEQVTSGSIDARTDVFSLGAVLWETLTGHRLFTGNSELEIINKVCTWRIPPPSDEVPTLNHEFDDIVMTALQRNPALRFQSAEEMQQALVRLAGKYQAALTPNNLSHYVSELFASEREAEIAFDRQLQETRSQRSSGGRATAPAAPTTAPPPAPSAPTVAPATPKSRPIPEVEARGSAERKLPARGSAERALPGRSSGQWPTPSRVGSRPGLGTGPQMKLPSRPGRALRRVLWVTLLVVAAVALGVGWPIIRSSTENILTALREPEPTAPIADSTAVPTPQPTQRKRGRRHKRSTVARATPTATPDTTLSPEGATPLEADAVPTVETETPAPTAVAVGRVSIDSTPKGSVFVDGVDIGLRTPTGMLEVPAGTYEIRVVGDDEGLVGTQRVVVKADLDVSTHIELSPTH